MIHEDQVLETHGLHTLGVVLDRLWVGWQFVLWKIDTNLQGYILLFAKLHLTIRVIIRAKLHVSQNNHF
jgi:hypothetical protein